MIRRLTIRLISLLLMANGLAGIAAVWIGWTMTADLLDTIRQTSVTVAAQQDQLVESLRGVAVAVDDSAQATDGLSRSSTRARTAVTEATRTADDLAATFDQLAAASRLTVAGVQPLVGMAQSFDTNAEDFRQLSAALDEVSASLADNSREMARVGSDLQSIHSRLDAAAANLASLPSARLLNEGLATLELGANLFLALILFEAALSALTGLALFMMTVQPGVRAVDRPFASPDDAGTTSPPGLLSDAERGSTMSLTPLSSQERGRG